MIERGIVKTYDGPGRHGLVAVTDQNGVVAGEEVYFHFSQIRRVGRNAAESDSSTGEVTFEAQPDYTQVRPHVGDVIVIETDPEGRRPRSPDGTQRRAQAWTYAHIWDRLAKQLERVRQ